MKRRRRSSSRTTPSRCRKAGSKRSSSKDPLAIKAFQYDVACNGYELASGGIRNHRPEAMLKAFEIAGYGEETVVERFGGMYRAFHYGAPPHGGMAAGVDRIVMLLAGEQNLREVALFPMNQRAEDLLMGAPSHPAPKADPARLHIHIITHPGDQARAPVDAHAKPPPAAANHNPRLLTLPPHRRQCGGTSSPATRDRLLAGDRGEVGRQPPQLASLREAGIDLGNSR